MSSFLPATHRGFNRISKESLSWDQAQALARRAGTTILAVDNNPPNSGK